MVNLAGRVVPNVLHSLVNKSTGHWQSTANLTGLWLVKLVLKIAHTRFVTSRTLATGCT